MQVREVYERAIANVPPAPEKRYWQRYIYLWIRYALWEELEAEDADRTRQVYKACLNLIPHRIFTFSKVSPPSPLQQHRFTETCTCGEHTSCSSVVEPSATSPSCASLSCGKPCLSVFKLRHGPDVDVQCRRFGYMQHSLRSGRSASQQPGSSWEQRLACVPRTSYSGELALHNPPGLAA